MNMTEAAARLGKIIKRLGGGTSTTDEAELKALHTDMLDASGDAAPKRTQRKARAIAKARTTSAPSASTTAKPAAKSTGKKAKGK